MAQKNRYIPSAKTNAYMWSDSKYVSFGGRKYALDFNVLQKACFSSSTLGKSDESEITQIFDNTENNGLGLSQMVKRELKTDKNPQNDAIMHELIKLLMINLLDNSGTEDTFVMDFGTAITINTLISWGILVEVNEDIENE